MTSHYLQTKIAGSLLAISLLFGIGITSSVTTQAQWPNSSRSRDYEREQRRRQREYERQQRRQQREASRSDDWRYRDNNRDNGYGNNIGRYGDGLPNYGGSFELRQTALNAGYNEGIKEGRKDRQRGGSSDYRDKGSYRNATTDYNSRLGDRELYREYFRVGFQNGYRDGYGVSSGYNY
ncbi:MAG: hypothetical protein ACR2G5_05995 [Pyrinomonadaceae bacterium]